MFAFYFAPTLKLLLQAQDVFKAATELTQDLQVNTLSDREKKLSINVFKHKISALDASISSGIWAPVIWATGQGEKTARFHNLVSTGKEFLTIAPGILGFDGPRRYLLAFQNSAEARGTGGIIGAYAKIEVEHGRAKILATGSNATLKHMDDSPVFISKEFRKVYGSDPGIWQNSNMSPHFPYGAQIWLGLWRNQYGENLDGVIAVDPIVLSKVLSVIGPITMPDGTVITSESVVEETLSTVYQRFETDNNKRKNYVVHIAQLTLEKLISGGYSKFALARALISPVNQGRVLAYSVRGIEEKTLAKSALGGFLSEEPNNEFRAVIQNTSGNKMDYYLDRSVTINSISCAAIRRTRITVRLTSNVSPNLKLPTYVMGRLDLGLPGGKQNSHGVTLFTYGPVGAKLLTARVIGGGSTAGILGTERKRQVAITSLDLRAGQTRTVSIVFEGGTGPVTYVEQPLVRPGVNRIIDKCVNSFEE